MLELPVVVKVESSRPAVQSSEGDIAARERRNVGELRGAESSVLSQLPGTVPVVFLSWLDDGGGLGHTEHVPAGGRVELPGYPASLRVRILLPGIVSELLVDGKTLRPRRAELETDVGDVESFLCGNTQSGK